MDSAQVEFLVHVVDPDHAIAEGLAALLSTYDIQIDYYPDAESLLERWAPRQPCRCCLVIEAALPGLSGPALLKKLSEKGIEVPVLLLVSTASPELLEVAHGSTGIDVVEKPCANGTLVEKLLRLRDRAAAVCG